MPLDPGSELIPTRLDRVLDHRDTYGVVLAAEKKRFIIFVGQREGEALRRRLDGEKTDRPLTHDLIAYILTGFDIQVEKVVISSIVANVFCATLVLTRKIENSEERTEVRLDARASDSLVIALGADSPIWVTRRVLDAVDDVTDALARADPDPEAEPEKEEDDTE